MKAASVLKVSAQDCRAETQSVHSMVGIKTVGGITPIVAVMVVLSRVVIRAVVVMVVLSKVAISLAHREIIVLATMLMQRVVMNSRTMQDISHVSRGGMVVLSRVAIRTVAVMVVHKVVAMAIIVAAVMVVLSRAVMVVLRVVAMATIVVAMATIVVATATTVEAIVSTVPTTIQMQNIA